ncbi:MAG TPA: LysR family transcriptional regulator [Roseiarcus sp.]|nr:LysR family transcriptional regulator [Roseiarcus sp.]
MRFDLLSLKLFVIVCEQQSISRTAEMEHIAASAVSKRMSDLEVIVRTPLFMRSQKGLDMTPAAHDLLKHARIVLRDLGQLESEMLDHAKGRRGDVRLRACHSPIVQHLPGDLADFLALNPEIRVSIDEGLSRHVAQSVVENAADIGVFGGGMAATGLHSIPYRTDRLVVITPNGHPLSRAESVTFAELVEYDIVGPQQGSCLDNLLTRAAAGLGRSLRIRIRVNGFEPSSCMVEAGLGVALVSEHHALRRLASGALCLAALDEPWAVRQWKICSRDPKALPAPVRLLLDHLSARGGRRETPLTLPSAATIAKYTAARTLALGGLLR